MNVLAVERRFNTLGIRVTFRFTFQNKIAGAMSGYLRSNDSDVDHVRSSPSSVIIEPQSVSSPEATWQYLGDLPYRRIPIYSNVKWSTSTSDNAYHHGLAHYPPSALQRHAKIVNAREVQSLLNSSTSTLVAACPFGGPIAAVTIPNSPSKTFVTTTIRIMTNAGRSIATIAFPPPNSSLVAHDIVTLGWTRRAVLVLVARDGWCLTYQINGTMLLPPFYLIVSESKNAVVVQAATVYEAGAAVVTTQQQVALAEFGDELDSDADQPSIHPAAFVRRITSTGGKRPHHFASITDLSSVTVPYTLQNGNTLVTIAVLPRIRTASHHPEVFLSTSDNSVVIVDLSVPAFALQDVNCRSRILSPICKMTFAPNGRFLACFTEQCMLTVISTSFETKVLDFDTSEGSTSPPLDMQWCGEDSVVLHWKNLGILMVGPYGDWLRFPYSSSQADGGPATDHLYLIPEMDCCRVITDTTVEILQRVPPATAQLLRIGSIETSAMLLDASDSFHAGIPSSDETIRTIIHSSLPPRESSHDEQTTDPLLDGIECCIEAATREYDIVTQKRLLRAASFGLHYSYKRHGDQAVMGVMVRDASQLASSSYTCHPTPTAQLLVSASNKIRVLNALRNPQVGVVMSAAQFEAISSTGVVARLIAMQRPALAVAVAKYLSLPPAVQLYARAAQAAALVSWKGPATEAAASVTTSGTPATSSASDTELAQAAIRIINEEQVESLQPSSTGASRAAGVGAGTLMVSSVNQQATSMNRGAFATVAMAATEAGRPGVASLLLMLETSIADKVPALIANGLYSDAIAVATTARYVQFFHHSLLLHGSHLFDCC
jgi:vacuolar protein sorting-associated protein 16